MPVYRCPIHSCWVDSERDGGCPQCLQAGGTEARKARRRNRKPPLPAHRRPPREKRRWPLYLFMLGLGAGSLALPQVQGLLREQGLGEVADRAQGLSEGARHEARSVAEKLGVQEPREAQHTMPSERFTLRVRREDGALSHAYLPPRDPGEPRPLLVWLPPRTTTAAASLSTLQPLAKRHRFAVITAAGHAEPSSPRRTWAPGEDAQLGPDERYVVACVQELIDDERFALDGTRVLLAGVADSAQTALHLATHHARFSHAALFHAAPSAADLGPRKPPVLLIAGGGDDAEPGKAEVTAAFERLRGLGYPAQRTVADTDREVGRDEVESAVRFWLGGPAR